MAKRKIHTRQIKLQPKHQASSWRTKKIVPLLILSGLWLEESGFKAGELVTITVEPNKLIIKANQP